MIFFFSTPVRSIIATAADHRLDAEEMKKLCWLYGEATPIEGDRVEGLFVGPRREMVTPWSTNAVEITQNMNLNGISRIEEFFPVASRNADYDQMLQRMYEGIGQEVFCVNRQPEPVKHVDNLEEYNEKEGLALSTDEMAYLHHIEKQLGRPLTDSEIFGFAQINSEHCRHKIFGGTFIIDGEEKESSLFAMIKRTTAENPGNILSAYKDNVALVSKMREMGVNIEVVDETSMRVSNKLDSLRPVDVKTLPHPGFLTDMQSIMCVLTLLADGTSTITETVFENRFMHVEELRRMNAKIRIEGRSSLIEGLPHLEGTTVKATDLRSGAALVIAGLMATGTTKVIDIYHIDRGYVDIEEKMRKLGADIQRIDE